jgi:hypothetical protein
MRVDASLRTPGGARRWCTKPRRAHAETRTAFYRANGTDEATSLKARVPVRVCVWLCRGTGSGVQGTTNVRGRPVSTTVVYSGDSASLFVDDCLQATTAPAAQAGAGVMIGTRNNEYGR